MESIRQLFVSLGLEWDAAGFLQAELAMKGLELAAQALVQGLRAVVSGTVEAVVATAEYGAGIDDAVKKTGIAAETLQELGYAAAQSGSSAGEMQDALTKLSRTMAAAADGGKEAQETFRALGVRATDADGTLRPLEDVFDDLSEAFVNVDNPAKRSALAMDVFGRSGAQLLPLLLEGRDGIGALRDEANALGLVMSNDAVVAAEAFGDSMGAIGAFVSSLKRDLGSLVIEGIAPLVGELVEWIKQNRELIKTRVHTFARLVVTAVRGLVAVLQQAGRVLKFMIDNWRGFALLAAAVLIPLLWSIKAVLLEQLVAFALNAAAAIAYGATQVAAGLAAAAAWTAANAPLLLSMALLAVLLLAAEDVWVALEGGDSVIGELGPKWTAFLDQWSQAVSESPIVNALKSIVFYVSDLEGRLLPMLKSSWASSLLQPLSAAIELLFKLFRGTATFGDYLKTVPLLGSIIGNAQSASSLFASGGASSPSAGAAAAVQAGGSSSAPQFRIGELNVTAAPGQSPQEVAGAVTDSMDQWWGSRVQEFVTQTQGQ